jgi:hypothetical protein
MRAIQWLRRSTVSGGTPVERADEAIRHEPVIYATNTTDGYLRCQCGWPDPIEEGHFTEHFGRRQERTKK